ncbi:MAG: thiamine phosphate synthase [Terriglobales bacterium]
MPARPLLYYITDRTQFPGDEATGRRRLLDKIAEAACCGVDYIQLREKDLSARDLEVLAREAVSILRQPKMGTEDQQLKTVFLINSRTDVALATGADGVHLRSDDISAAEVRHLWQTCCRCSAGATASVTVSVSCHQPSEVQQADIEGADLALFAPVFEKHNAPGTAPAGLARLRRACQNKIPVLALGGITLENASSCLAAGADGIAAIRLFQDNDIAEVVRRLRAF